jgi:hypothetical protein
LRRSSFPPPKNLSEPEIKPDDFSPRAALLEARRVSKGELRWTIYCAASSLTRRASKSIPEPFRPENRKQTGSKAEAFRKQNGSDSEARNSLLLEEN